MRFIPSFVHGFMDYLFGIALAASPWLLGYAEISTATSISVVIGLGAILYSLITDYELGVLRVLPFGIHLIIDLVSGIFLLAAPWLFGLPSVASGPLITFGLIEVGAALLTNPRVQGFDRLTHSKY